jgi:hypothetical protein
MMLLQRRLLVLIAADENTRSAANQAASYGEGYGLLEACGTSPVSPAKERANRGEYADSLGRDEAQRWKVETRIRRLFFFTFDPQHGAR